MPSGAKKRKAAKKKKDIHSHQAENEGGEVSSSVSQDHGKIQDPSMEGEVVEVKKEDSEIKSNNIEIEIGSKLKSSNGSSSSSSSGGSSDDEVEKKVVVLESAPIESLTQEVEDLEISPVVEPVIKPVDSLVEEVSQDCDEPKHEEKKDLVVEEKPVVVEDKTVVVNENDLKDDCLTSSVVVESISKENGASLDEEVSLESKDGVASSTSLKDSISEVNGGNRANDNGTIGQSDSDRKLPVAASIPLAVQKTTSWKGCCGIFELFSGSGR